MIVKPISRIIQELDAKSFTVIGSPGSDGLGPGVMQVFAAAVSEAEGDFIVTLGDLSPLGRCMSLDEWARFEDAAGVWRKRVSLLVCGHGSSYFEDEVDGLRLVVSGGGRRRLLPRDRVAPPTHHIVEFSATEGGDIVGRYQSLRPGGYAGRLPEIDQYLDDIPAPIQ